MFHSLTLRPDQLGHRIVKVVPATGRRLLLTFDGGEQRVLNMTRFIQPETAFESFATDPRLFRAVYIVGRTIGWPNGATLDPDVLFHLSKPTNITIGEITRGVLVRHRKDTLEKQKLIVHRGNKETPRLKSVRGH